MLPFLSSLPKPNMRLLPHPGTQCETFVTRVSRLWLSILIFSSWQRLCSSYRFVDSSLPPLALGILLSTSITCHCCNWNPQCGHFPLCCFRIAFLWASSECVSSLVLQYIMSLSSGFLFPVSSILKNTIQAKRLQDRRLQGRR